MTDLKPKIFIGSSTDGYDTAKKVKDFLSVAADCYLWQDSDVWEPNMSTFDNLLRMVGFFDFGVFVATADDLTFTNETIVTESRDNVIVEMSLFLGAMGRDKSFLLVEDGVKLPSDFNGIYMPRFKVKDDNSIKAACDAYARKIDEHYTLGHLSLYPTTVLAISYYNNFVAGQVQGAQNAQAMEIDGVKYSDFSLNVVLPNDLKGAIGERAVVFYKKHNFIENSLQTPGRMKPVKFQFDPGKAPLAMMYDMPTTLSGIEDSLALILQKGFYGRTKIQELIEQKELNNFRRVLQMKIDESPLAKAMVTIMDEF